MKKTDEIKKIIEHHRKLFYEGDPQMFSHREIVFEEMCEAIKTVCDKEEDNDG